MLSKATEEYPKNLKINQKNSQKVVFDQIVQNRNRRLGDNHDGAIIPVSNCHSQAVTANIGIGDPIQIFDVAIDTNSKELWIPSNECDNCGLFGMHMYDSSASVLSTPINDNSKFEASLESGDINLQGKKSRDEVRIGTLVLDKQVFGTISSVPESYSPICGNIDGILGLSLPSKDNHVWYDLVMDGIKKKYEYPIVSIYLNGKIDDFQTRHRSLQEDYFDDNEDDFEDIGEKENTGMIDQSRMDDNVNQEEELYDDHVQELGPKEEGEVFNSRNKEIPTKDEVEYDDLNDYYMEAEDGNEKTPTEDEVEYDDLDYYKEAEEMFQQENVEDDADDYEEIYENEETAEYSTNDILEEGLDEMYGEAEGELIPHEITPRPMYAQSELIFGGVDPTRYQGCLFWHPLAEQSPLSWSLKLDNSNNQIATIDTKTAVIRGPEEEVGRYLESNNAECHLIEEDYSIGQAVSCNDDKFDIAFSDCEASNFKDLNFEANGEIYSLGFDDLVEIFFDESGNEVCRYRLIATSDATHWALGTPFLNKYYVALDMKRNQIGLALANHNEKNSNIAQTYCKDDEPLFILEKDFSTVSTKLEATTMTNNEGALTNEIDENDAEANMISYIIAPITVLIILIIALIVKKKRTANASQDSFATNEISSTQSLWNYYDEEHEIS